MSAPTKVQLVGGHFQDATGNVLALGNLVMELVQDEQLSSSTGQVCGGIKITVLLDENGSVQGTSGDGDPAQYVWPTDAMLPLQASYTVWAYSAEGELAWGPNYNLRVPSGSTFDVDLWVPNSASFGSGGGSGSSLVLQVNGVANVDQALLNLANSDGSVTLTDEGNGTVEISAANTYPVIVASLQSGSDLGQQIASSLALLPATGGVIDARGYTTTQSISANLTLDVDNVTILLPAVNINITSHQIIVPAETMNVRLLGVAPYGGEWSGATTGGTFINYTGDSYAILVGAEADPATNTLGFQMRDIYVNLTSAGTAAIGLGLICTQQYRLDGCYFNCLLTDCTQEGVRLDGSGNYTGGTILECNFNGGLYGLYMTGAGDTELSAANTIIGCHFAGVSGVFSNPTVGIYFIKAAQNFVLGGDIEGWDVGFHISNNNGENYVCTRYEANTNDYIIDSGAQYNMILSSVYTTSGVDNSGNPENLQLDPYHIRLNPHYFQLFSTDDEPTTLAFDSGESTAQLFTWTVRQFNANAWQNVVDTDQGYSIQRVWPDGTVDTSGTAVTWQSGNQFTSNMAGETIYIQNTPYTVSTYNSATSLTLSTSAGTQSGANYNFASVGGISWVGTNGNLNINTWAAGEVLFNAVDNSGDGGVGFYSGGASPSKIAGITNAGAITASSTVQATDGFISGSSSGANAGSGTYNTFTVVGGLVTAISDVSDERLKNHKSYVGGLEAIKKIVPIRFTYNEVGSTIANMPTNREFVGFSAQNVQTAIPEAVHQSGSHPDFLGLDDRPIIAALVDAVKTLAAKVEALENKH
jgi:hypothetical protein